MIKRAGFMLIEVMIAAVIASIIGIALFMLINQINRTTVFTRDYVDIYGKAAIVHKQLEKDLSGFFLPLASQKELTEKKETPAKDLPADKNQAPDKNNKLIIPEPKSDEKPIKRITKSFFGKNKNKNLEQLTFITNNPMQVYWSDKVGSAKPRAVRVMYRLLPDREFKNSFILTRQESNNLYVEDLAKQDKNSPRQFEVINGIKSLTIEYAVEKPKEGDDKETKKKPKEYILKKEWNDEEEKSKESKDKQSPTKQFPDYVAIKMALWDDQKKRDTQFVFNIHFLAQGVQPAEPKVGIADSILNQMKSQNQQTKPAAVTAPASNAAPAINQPKPIMPSPSMPPRAHMPSLTMPPAHNGTIPITLDVLENAIKTGDHQILNNLDKYSLVEMPTQRPHA